MSRTKRFTCAFYVVTMCRLVSNAHAQGPIGLGNMPGGIGSSPTGMSFDGSVVVGRTFDENVNPLAFRWTEESGMQLLPMPANGDWSEALGVSDDGSTIVGRVVYFDEGLEHAVLWTGDNQAIDIDLLNSECYSHGYSVAANGSAVAGVLGCGSERAIRWTPANGIMNLGTLPGGNRSWAFAITTDGSTVIGFSESSVGERAFKWNNTTGLVSLGTVPGGGNSVALSASYDGSVVVGYSDIAAGRRAFRWTTAGGMVNMGTLPGENYSSAGVVSGDGTTVAGAGEQAGGFIWTADTGMLGTKAFLTDRGVDLSGWTISSINALNEDGLCMAGQGFHDGQNQAFVVKLDRDGDGLLDSWERKGIPYIDANGQLCRYTLPDASENHKDIYVEMDAMDGFAPSSNAMELVRLAFAAAPVSNPDCIPGVNIHIIADERHVQPKNWSDPPWTDFDSFKALHFGATEEQGNTEMLAAKRKAFRYCVFARSQGNKTTVGKAEIVGDDFMVTLGGWSSVHAGVPTNGRDEDQASAFMHELGHNLGLEHGGTDCLNHKPNYVSIMNYIWAYPRILTANAPPEALAYRAGWRLDYASSSQPTLDEESLNEQAGIGGRSGIFVPVCVRGDACSPSLEPESGPVDWNGDGVRGNAVDVIADINDRKDRPVDCACGSCLDILTSSPDWSLLKYKMSGSPNFEENMHVEPACPGGGALMPEMTFDDLLKLSHLGCPNADINWDCVADSADITAIVAVLLGQETDPALIEMADQNKDGVADGSDVSDFVTAYINS